MRALATVFRLLAMFALFGLVGVLWFKWDTFTSQTHSFLDEVVSDAYTILQSERDDQWKDITTKKSSFNEIFDANDPVGQNDENPLSMAAQSLASAEKSILKNPDYRESLENLNLEYGVDALVWNSESKSWQTNPATKLTPPASFQDPFSDESKFPKKDIKKEDGTIVRGVPRPNRLRTVIGMFYKDRDDKFKEIAKLREMVVMRDIELREYQNLYAKEKERKEQLEDEVGELTVKVAGLEEDLKREKEERQAEKDAAEQKEEQLNRLVASLEEEKIKTAQEHQEFIDTLRNEQKEQLAALQDEVRKADAEGYKRGIDEMIAKQQGGEIEKPNEEVTVNPFLPSEDGPPKLSQAELMLAAQAKTIGESGVPSTVGRVDGKAGMILLPLGSERGVALGNVYTLWKANKKAARIRIQSVSQGFSLAYLLPQFGTPQELRPGDSVHVVPEIEETL
ncbi:MAG TPA: hypothetical protein DCL00_04655 [Opitutae bacterium]|nr:hypothetical protein [Opitutae bacterium]